MIEPLEILPAGFLSSIRLQVEQTGGRDPFAKLRELHREGKAYGSGKPVCEHCAELCHSETGLGCGWPGPEPDGAWPCPTIQILDAIEPDDAPMTAITEVVEGGWYRSLLPSGELWCESSNPDDMRREGPPGLTLTLQRIVTTTTQTWVPYEVDDEG